MNSENYAVREFEALSPRLREGLEFSIQEHGERRVCIIEDRTGSRFHRVGLEEAQFLRTLDGSRSVASILAALAQQGGAFPEHQALQMIRWALDQHLLVVESQRVNRERERTANHWRLASTWLNPLTVRIPLGRPDAFFSWVEPKLRWALGPVGALLWVLVVGWGFSQVMFNWQEFQSDAGGTLSRHNWLGLAGVWVLLKVVHEFGHGLWCKHFGATVREIGLIFILFMPMAYVDATSSLSLPSKWRRIMVALAGLWMEFFVAAVAAIVWSQTQPGWWHTISHNAVITGTLVTLFFNANPLMRFDGYFVFSDFFEVANLATRGRQWVLRTVAWVLLGAKNLRPEPAIFGLGEREATPDERVGSRSATLKPGSRAAREERLVAAYGVAAWIWQIVVLAGLLSIASVMFRGGGLLLAIGAALAWVALPFWRFLQMLSRAIDDGAAHWQTFIWRLLALILVVLAILLTPYSRTVTESAILEMADTEILRADCPGFVQAVWVKDGDLVKEGQLLVSLRNEEALSELAKAKWNLAQQELKARIAYTREDMASFQGEREKVAAFLEAVANHQRYVASLEIRSPRDGRVINRNLDKSEGVFVRSGMEVVRVGRAESSDVKITVSQEAVPDFRSAVGLPLEVRVEGRGQVFPAKLMRVEARASRQILYPALTALAGGPLALRRADENGPSQGGTVGAEGAANAQGEAGESHSGYELASPHFLATANLQAGPLPSPLQPGELARVRFRSPRSVTLWGEIQAAVNRRWHRIRSSQ